MNQPGGNRWSLLSGVIFVILWVVAGAQMGAIGFLPEGEAVATFFGDNSSRFWFVGYLGTASAFFLLWFSGSLRGVLNRAGLRGHFLADTAFGSGVAAAVLAAAAYSRIPSLAERAGGAAGIAPDVAAAIIDGWGGLTGLALPVVFAALIGATGLAVLRTKLLPVWFGWLSVILAIGLITPASYLVMSVGLLWTVVLSVWLFAHSAREPASASEVLTQPSGKIAQE